MDRAALQVCGPLDLQGGNVSVQEICDHPVGWMVEISGADKFFYSKKAAENARRRYEKMFDAEVINPYPVYRRIFPETKP